MAKAKIGRVRAYVDGRWQDGSPRVLGPHSHAVWLSSVVFDGARAFDGVAPDLDRHCASPRVRPPAADSIYAPRRPANR